MKKIKYYLSIYFEYIKYYLKQFSYTVKLYWPAFAFIAFLIWLLKDNGIWYNIMIFVFGMYVGYYIKEDEDNTKQKIRDNLEIKLKQKFDEWYSERINN